MTGQYILVGKEPVLEPDLFKWAMWLEANWATGRRVAFNEQGPIHISTIFLGLDHRFGRGRPLLFETMVFGSRYDHEMERYSTWEEAEAGHKRWCAKVFLQEQLPLEVGDAEPASRTDRPRSSRGNAGGRKKNSRRAT